jgi:small-conductance mechanosensitive channel
LWQCQQPFITIFASQKQNWTTVLNDLWLNIQGYYNDLIDLLPRLGLAVLILLGLLGVARFIRSFSQRKLYRRVNDPLLARFIANLVGSAVVVLGLMLALKIVGLSGVAVGLLSTAGVGAFVIGFAFKDIGENFLAGVVLAFNRPFRIGDTVELAGFTGEVVSLNLRDTQMKTADGKDVFIPNSIVVKSPVANRTLDEFLREEFRVQLNYSADLGKAASVIQAVLDDADEILHEEGKLPEVVYGDMASTTIYLVARYWLNVLSMKMPAANVQKILFDRAKAGLKAAGIALPADPSEAAAQQVDKNTDN